MKNKTKALVLACLCIFATLMLTACGGKSSSDSADVTVDSTVMQGSGRYD